MVVWEPDEKRILKLHLTNIRSEMKPAPLQKFQGCMERAKEFHYEMCLNLI